MDPYRNVSPGTSRDLIGFETPPKAKSGLPTEEALSGMTDFKKLGVYLNFLVVVLEGGKRNYVNQNMIGAIRKANALHKQIEMQMELDANSKESNNVNILTTPTIPETKKKYGRRYN